MDQVSTWSYTGQYAASSQFFEAGLAGYNVAAIDNFTTPAGTIDLVQAVLMRFNGTTSYAPVQDWSVEVYSSPAAAAANLAGDIGAQTVLPGGVTLTANYLGAGAGIALLSVPVSIPVNAGSYWIAVIPRMDFGGGNGQVGVALSSSGSPLGLNAEQANPAGGFAFPGNHAAISPAADLAYLVDVGPASGVPEPATWTAMIGGFAAFALRRYRASR